MKLSHTFVILPSCPVAWPTASPGQHQEATRDVQCPLLTLDDADSLALQDNRLVRNPSLETQELDFRANPVKTRRLPRPASGSSLNRIRSRGTAPSESLTPAQSDLSARIRAVTGMGQDISRETNCCPSFVNDLDQANAGSTFAYYICGVRKTVPRFFKRSGSSHFAKGQYLEMPS